MGNHRSQRDTWAATPKLGGKDPKKRGVLKAVASIVQEHAPQNALQIKTQNPRPWPSRLSTWGVSWKPNPTSMALLTPTPSRRQGASP